MDYFDKNTFYAQEEKMGKAGYSPLCRPGKPCAGKDQGRRSLEKEEKKRNAERGFCHNADLSKISGPASSKVVQRLRPFLKGIDGGRLTLRISNALRKGLKEKKRLDLSALEGVEMQRDYPLHQLLLAPYRLSVKDWMFKIKIGIDSNCVKKQNSLTTHFYFETVMVYGDVAAENGLRVESTGSGLYAFGEEPEEICELSLSLPGIGYPGWFC